jgi:hypothetical protein
MVSAARGRRSGFIMKKNVFVPRVAAGLLGAVALAGASSAHAATPACAAPSSAPNPVYISAASVAGPLVQALATAVAPLGISIIYTNPDSCLALEDLLLNQTSTEPAPVKTLLLGPNGASSACTLSTQTPDIAISEVYASTCGYGSDAGTGGLAEVLGPINAMVFAVPGGATPSTATSISTEAAQVVFGYAPSVYTVQPWNSATNIFVREQTSGSEAMIGVAINLPTSKWINAATGSASPQQKTTATAMESAIAGVTTGPSATIGILGSENVYSFNAGSPAVPLNMLAYQQTGQACGYFPSSTESALDEVNVRQGRYAIWGPTHVFAHVDGQGSLTSPNTPSDASAIAAVLNFFIATGENPDAPLYPIGSLASGGADAGTIGADGGATISTADKKSFIAAEITPGYVVPWCAMEVLRTGEVGPEASYQAPEPCSCFFEETVQGAPIAGHTCTSCPNGNSDCAGTPSTPVCRYGFCEVQ